VSRDVYEAIDLVRSGTIGDAARREVGKLG
jgi:hypothetical protein